VCAVLMLQRCSAKARTGAFVLVTPHLWAILEHVRCPVHPPSHPIFQGIGGGRAEEAVAQGSLATAGVHTHALTPTLPALHHPVHKQLCSSGWRGCTDTPHTPGAPPNGHCPPLPTHTRAQLQGASTGLQGWTRRRRTCAESTSKYAATCTPCLKLKLHPLP